MFRLLAERGEVYTSLHGRVGEAKVLSRADFETGTVREMARMNVLAWAVQGSELLVIDQDPDATPSVGTVRYFDRNTLTRSPKSGPFDAWELHPLPARGEVAVVAKGTPHGIFLRKADGSVDPLTSRESDVLSDGVDLIQLKYYGDGRRPNAQVQRFDRTSSRWVTEFELDDVTRNSPVAMDHERIYLRHSGENGDDEIRIRNRRGELLHRVTLPSRARAGVHIAADAIYASDGVTLTRIDKATGVSSELATVGTTPMVRPLLTSDACYVYMTGPTRHSILRIPK